MLLSAAALLTVRLTVVLCTNVPLVPVMVSVYVPAVVLVALVTVNVEVPEVVMEAGLKLPLAPAGNPLTLRPTLPLKPLSALTVAVYVVPLPAVTVRDDGLAETVKSGTGVLATKAKPSSN